MKFAEISEQEKTRCSKESKNEASIFYLGSKQY
jgi:hypothetical protein